MSTRIDRAPGDLDLQELRDVGGDVMDAIVAYHAELPTRRVLPAATPAEVAEEFRGDLPEEGESAGAIIADWRMRVAPLLTALGSPRHFAYVNGSGSMIGIFADALAATTNTNAGAWKLGPAATEIERQCLRWIARFIGYPESAGGIVVTGGTMANYTAMMTALRTLAPYDSTPGGLQDEARSGRFLVHMSDHEGHVSVVRSADMMNLGRNAVRRVVSRADFTMDPAALDRALTEDRARGDHPFCVVAQLGSVNVGAIDPIDEIADVCAAHGVWLHGDGACGLLAAGVPELRERFRGIGRADSLSFDPHKWLGVPYDCGVVLVRDAERLRRTFSVHAPYLRGPEDSDERDGYDFHERGPEMTRGFRALKLWMTIRNFGAQGMRDAFLRSTRLASRLVDLARDHPDFEVLHEPVIYIASIRCVPNALADRQDDPEVRETIDRLNQEIVETIQRDGRALVMSTRIRGRLAIRMSICSQRTTETDIDSTFEAMAEAARRLSPTQRGERRC
jgi:glutamate/tyrosine decarboxylase-like PLP-dependent enzyme